MSDPAAIYRALYQADYNANHGEHWRPVWHRIATPMPATLLDVGCGRGRLVQMAKRVGIRATGCDLAPCEPWIEQASLPGLPYRRRQFEVVTCFDVLEHLATDDVPAAIAELRRVCSGRLIVSIATCSDRRAVPGIGEVELHLTQRPAAWWTDLLQANPIDVPGQPAWRHYMETKP